MKNDIFEYELIEDGIRITQYIGYEEMLAIPPEIDGVPVVEIGVDAFASNGMFLMSVQVPSSVKRIREGAFRTCVCLTELRLCEGVEVIEMEALYLTPIETLVLPKSLCRLDHPWELSGMQLFMESDHPCFYTDGMGLYKKEGDERILLVLTHVNEVECYEILDGTTIIGESAFAGSNMLSKIRIPNTVHTIESSALESCESLTEIELPEGLREIKDHAFSRCIGLQSLYLPSTLEVLGTHAISDTFGWSESLNGIRSVSVAERNPYYAVENEVLLYRKGDVCSLIKYFGHHHRYDIPDGVTEIRASAFRRADCYELGIPASVKHVEREAFRECKNLEWLYLEETGVALYVPRNPVYRKDEIVALLDCRDEDRPNPISPEELPEKWKKFGYIAISGNRENECKRDERYLFDYVGYDRLFPTYLNVPDHIGMVCCRLKYPVNLSDHVIQNYRKFVQGNWDEILEDIGAREDLEHLSDLTQEEFFTNENIEASMDVFNRMGKTKMLGFLMNYKNECLEAEEFDFSL